LELLSGSGAVVALLTGFVLASLWGFGASCFRAVSAELLCVAATGSVVRPLFV